MVRWVAKIVIPVFLIGAISCRSGEIEETEMATVTGYVYLSDALPAPGVHIYDNGAPSYSGYTDRNGFFRVDVPAGERTIVIDGGIFKTEVCLNLSEGEVRELFPSSAPFILINNTNFKIAVMLGAFDSIQAIFEQIGISRINSPDDSASGYVLYDPGNFPADLETLRKFDLLAFNCNAAIPPISSATLNEYVQQGGNIYASD
ncbi:MAG: hypothetical protein QMD82_05500 [bacterium]|nr:hypothetical protein [bacterium]